MENALQNSPETLSPAKQALIETIANQMEIGAEFSDGFVNLKSGMVCRIHEFDDSSEYQRLVKAGALQMIPTITSQDLYLWMVDFTCTMEDGALKRQMETALEGISSVWKFRNILYHNDAVSKRWRGFKREKLLSSAQDWVDYISRRAQPQ